MNLSTAETAYLVALEVERRRLSHEEHTCTCVDSSHFLRLQSRTAVERQSYEDRREFTSAEGRELTDDILVDHLLPLLGRIRLIDPLGIAPVLLRDHVEMHFAPRD